MSSGSIVTVSQTSRSSQHPGGHANTPFVGSIRLNGVHCYPEHIAPDNLAASPTGVGSPKPTQAAITNTRKPTSSSASAPVPVASVPTDLLDSNLMAPAHAVSTLCL